jgi:hypothetical protein
MKKSQIIRWLQRRPYGTQRIIAAKAGRSEALLSMWLSGVRKSSYLDAEVPKIIAEWTEAA